MSGGLVVNRLGIIVVEIISRTDDASADDARIESGIDNGHGSGASRVNTGGKDQGGQQAGQQLSNRMECHTDLRNQGSAESA